MENERMTILKMLEDGKITAGEASKLLQAVSETDARQAIRSEGNTQQSPPPMQKVETDSSVKRFEEFAGEMSKKFEIFAKDMEPKLQKFTEALVEGTANVADKISKSIATPPSSTPPRSMQPSSAPTKVSTPFVTSATNERSFEIKIDSNDCELNMSGLNGNILLKGYNGDKISGKFYCKAKRADALIEFRKLGNKYSLQYNEDDFNSVSIDAYIPEYLFKQIKVQTLNGEINLATLHTDILSVNNMNGNVTLRDIVCKHLSYETSNGKMMLENIQAEQAKIENCNGNSQIMNLDVRDLQMECFNGAIDMTISAFEAFSEYRWAIGSSNAALTVHVPGGSEIGYHVKAQTSLNEIRVGLTGMNYLTNGKTDLEARSIAYDSAKTRVNLSLETSNAPLTLH